MPSPATPHHPGDTTRGPSAPWLAFGFLLAGLGTVLLGPILPSISLRWHLSDSQTGPLFFAKFVGAFLGGITVPRRLRLGIVSGTVLSCFGFGAFGLCTGILSGSAALFVAGIGLGHIIASTNILAGYRYRTHTGSALASLNFFWSLGAVATGLIVAAMMPRFGLRNLLFYFAASFLAVGIGGRLAWQDSPSPETPVPAISIDPNPQRLAPNILLRFSLFLFLYGGLETCLAGWLTTYTLRYSGQSGAHLVGGQSATVLFLAALAAGRALSSIALRYYRETTIQRLTLALAFVFIGALASTSHAASLSLWSILLGLALAPFFPTTFALLIHHQPTPREAGFVLAVSGLGAAAFPWLMGIVSTHTDSLRTAMAVPMVLALLLLAVSFADRPAPPHTIMKP